MCASRAVDCRFEAPEGPLARIRKMAKLTMGEIETISILIGSGAPGSAQKAALLSLSGQIAQLRHAPEGMTLGQGLLRIKLTTRGREDRCDRGKVLPSNKRLTR